MRYSFIPIVLIVLFSLFSCSSTMKEGSTLEKPTLLVGSAVFEATGYKVYGNSSINGEHLSGMEIVIVNEETDKEITCKANNSGFFFRTLEKGARYYVKELYFIDKGNDGSYISLTTALSSKFMIVQEGDNNVINLGKIEWFSDHDKAYSETKWASGYSDVENYFKKHYPESPWNKAEWIDFPWEKES